MRSDAPTPDAYLDSLEADRSAQLATIRNLVNDSLAAGFVERMAYGMISWDVPLEVSGPTYNGQPLSYVALAAQKRHNALYLSCVYASPERSERLAAGFKAAGKTLDMGKSCIRFKRPDDLALDVIASEIASMTPENFASFYQQARSAHLSS